MKWIIGCLLAVMMVSPVMAGEDPYIAIVGNDCVNVEGNPESCQANPFYFSPKYEQFLYDQELVSVPVCYSPFPGFPTFPVVNQFTRVGAANCEQFRSQTALNQPEICDTTGTWTSTAVFQDRGNRNAVVRAGNAGFYEWYVRLPKKPSGEINLVLQCGVIKPNTFNFNHYNSVPFCAAETGERVGPSCTRVEVEPGINPLVVGALPKITATAYPGPFNSFTPFALTAFRNPGTYGPFTALGALQNGDAAQVLSGTANGQRILLKSCMDKTVVTKLPVTDQINALGQLEADLEMGDIIYVRLDIPRANTVDVYCHAQSLKVMGIGESFF